MVYESFSDELTGERDPMSAPAPKKSWLEIFMIGFCTFESEEGDESLCEGDAAFALCAAEEEGDAALFSNTTKARRPRASPRPPERGSDDARPGDGEAAEEGIEVPPEVLARAAADVRRAFRRSNAHVAAVASLLPTRDASGAGAPISRGSGAATTRAARKKGTTRRRCGARSTTPGSSSATCSSATSATRPAGRCSGTRLI